MRVARATVPVVAAAALAALAAACGGEERAGAAPATSACPATWRTGWQKLANRIDAPVYCPGWLPSPLTGEIGGPSTSINSVDRDRSYLISFIYKEKAEEIHVNLRGYPGKTRIPTCIDTRVGAGRTRRVRVPCFSDPRGRRRVGGIDVTVYTVNRDADEWHVLYAWRRDGTLYTLSEHIALPFSSYRRVVSNLDRMMRRLELVEPKAA